MESQQWTNTNVDVRRQTETDKILSVAGGKNKAEDPRDNTEPKIWHCKSTTLMNLLVGMVGYFTGIALTPAGAVSMRLRAKFKAKAALMALNVGVHVEATLRPLDDGR